MQVLYERCAGLDVHKKTVVTCRIIPDGKGGWQIEVRTFSTMLVHKGVKEPSIKRPGPCPGTSNEKV